MLILKIEWSQSWAASNYRIKESWPEAPYYESQSCFAVETGELCKYYAYGDYWEEIKDIERLEE